MCQLGVWGTDSDDAPLLGAVKPTLLVFPDYIREAARGWWGEREMLLLVQHKLPFLLLFLLFLLLK